MTWPRRKSAPTEEPADSRPFAGVPPCERCAGHQIDGHMRGGGYLLVIQLSKFGYWEATPAACSCALGEWLRTKQGMPEYDRHPLRLEGLNHYQINKLSLLTAYYGDITRAATECRDQAIETAVDWRMAREREER